MRGFRPSCSPVGALAQALTRTHKGDNRSSAALCMQVYVLQDWVCYTVTGLFHSQLTSSHKQ